MSSVNEKLSKVQVELKAKKSRYNKFGKYNYRNAEDILEAVKPYNTKYGINVTINEEFIPNDGLGIIKATARITDNEGGKVIHCGKNMQFSLAHLLLRYFDIEMSKEVRGSFIGHKGTFTGPDYVWNR